MHTKQITTYPTGFLAKLILPFRRVWLYLFVGIVLLLLLVLATTSFTIEGDFEGLYLLRGTNSWFEVKDEIFLGEYERLLTQFEWEPFVAPLRGNDYQSIAEPYLKYTWHPRNGRGYIQSSFPDGTKLLMCFGRFLDSDGMAPHGLFVGGGLPLWRYEHGDVTMNETGMAFFDGNDWRHIWCNANETIAPATVQPQPVSPSHWRFLGSKVLFATHHELVLKSSHAVDLNGVPFRINRFVLYRAGDPYFVLVNQIKNVGTVTTGYYYVYGDEPWVGEYGSSKGNVGWTRDRLLNYEGTLDPHLYSYAGMFDHGNPVISEKSSHETERANFIEWLGNAKPDLVYFSNKIGAVADEKERVPLADPLNRVFMLQWGPRYLLPHQSEVLMMAIGMAGHVPNSDIPVKPKITIDWHDLNFVLSNEE